jgi:hypothetical protein
MVTPRLTIDQQKSALIKERARNTAHVENITEEEEKWKNDRGLRLLSSPRNKLGPSPVRSVSDQKLDPSLGPERKRAEHTKKLETRPGEEASERWKPRSRDPVSRKIGRWAPIVKKKRILTLRITKVGERPRHQSLTDENGKIRSEPRQIHHPTSGIRPIEKGKTPPLLKPDQRRIYQKEKRSIVDRNFDKPKKTNGRTKLPREAKN